jgi:LmbE family N-acetylglucosaminyl deacetylase
MVVVAPHPDDEILGAGGSMARAAAEGSDVYVVIMTRGIAPKFDEAVIEQTRRELRVAHAMLGVRETISLDLEACALDTLPHGDVNAALVGALQRLRPDAMYIPFAGDIHLDHQITFLSSLVACRPPQPYAPAAIYAYETLSETNWNAPFLTPGFRPNVFVDISDYLDVKLRAMRTVASELRPFPHERSIEALTALATLRGATVNRRAAEAFVLIRQII